MVTTGDIAMRAGLFPVVHSLIHGRALLELIAHTYDVGAPGTCQLLKSSLNDTYLLTARDGRYVVRVYRASRPLTEVLYELELLNHLAARGVPVSAPMPARDGGVVASLRAPEGTRHMVVFSYAAGAPLESTNTDHCHLAGQLLGAIHEASDEFETTHCRPSLDIKYLIDAPLESMRRFVEHRPADAAYFVELAGRLRADLQAAADAGLDWGVCHGDFGAKNILITDQRAVTVLDFDFCGPGWRPYDFTSFRRAAIQHGRLAIWKEFLRGYTAARRLALVDEQAVHLFRALRGFSMMGVFAQNVGQWSIATMDDRRINRWLRFFRDWEAEPVEGIARTVSRT